MRATYKIAGRIIEIDSVYDEVHRLCRDYISDGEADIRVKTTPESIEYERERSARTEALEGRKTNGYRSGYLERLAVYRQISEKMPFFDTFLFHGSAIAVDEEAYIFTAKSGTGKSTHAALWRKLLGDRAVMVNDDKPMIEITETGAVVHGTPYNGKHNLGCNISVPVRAVCILSRSEENVLIPAQKHEAYKMLMQQSYRPADPAALAKTVSLVDRLADSVQLWTLGCNMDISAAKTAFEGMTGK